MEVRKAESWEKPLPRPDDLEAHFYRAAARGELLFQRCPTCDHRQFYPRSICTACGADPEWATASGRGTVHTFTIVRQNFAKGFREELPYAVVMVELESTLLRDAPSLPTEPVGPEPVAVCAAITPTLNDGM